MPHQRTSSENMLGMSGILVRILGDFRFKYEQWRIQGEGPEVQDPPYQTRRLQLWDWIWIRSRRCHNLKCSKIKGNFAIQDFHTKPTQLKQSWVPWYCVTKRTSLLEAIEMTARARHLTKATFMPFLCYWATLIKILKNPYWWEKCYKLLKTVQEEVIRITGEYVWAKVTQPSQ